MEPKVDKRSNSVDVVLDEEVFPRPVGLAAAYRFIDRCYVLVESRPRRRLSVRLKGKQPLAAPALAALAGEFRNELLHQISISLDVVTSTIGSFLLAFIGERDEHPLGNLPRSKLLFGPFFQVADGGLCQI